MNRIEILIRRAILLMILLWVLQSCSPSEGNKTGHEYMPDMAHSIAVEANVYTNYNLNTWEKGSVKDLKSLSEPGSGIEGTVPRGYAGDFYGGQAISDKNTSDEDANAIRVPTNGSVPYPYKDTEEERQRATEEIQMNPFPITERGLDKGEELYNTFCGICHGEKGAGNGYLVRDDGGVYPAQPVSFLTEEFLAASNGRYYHAIMHGKNVMGHYKDKISFEERWHVIHYIRALQAKELGKIYTAQENTLDEFSTPEAEWVSDEVIDDKVSMIDNGMHSDEYHKEGTH